MPDKALPFALVVELLREGQLLAGVEQAVGRLG
jgi:hypothetical protein